MANISTALRDALASAADIFDEGVLEIRSGSPPGPNAADSGTLLASITLPADAFTGPSAGVLTKSGDWEDASADGTGEAGHFRMKRSGDTGGATGSSDERIEGTVGLSAADLILDSLDITTGQGVVIDTFTVTMPAGPA